MLHIFCILEVSSYGSVVVQERAAAFAGGGQEIAIGRETAALYDVPGRLSRSVVGGDGYGEFAAA